MNQEINFSDLNEVQKEKYIKYILENNIPLQEDSSKKEIIAQIKLQTSQKQIIQKYSSSNQQQNQCSPPRKSLEFKDYLSLVNRNNIKTPIQNSSTPIHSKKDQQSISDNKENLKIGRLKQKSPQLRCSSPFSAQPVNKSQNIYNSANLTQKKLFPEEITYKFDSQKTQKLTESKVGKVLNKLDDNLIENIVSGKSPNRRKSNIPSSVLKEVDFFSKNFAPSSDNKSTRNSINIKQNNISSSNINQNVNKLHENRNSHEFIPSFEYIPSTLRKKSATRDVELNEKETKRKSSISPNQKKQRSSSSYQVFQPQNIFCDQKKNNLKISNKIENQIIKNKNDNKIINNRNNNSNQNNKLETRTKSKSNSQNKRGFTLEKFQDPFNVTISTINSKETNSQSKFTTECSLFNKSPKCGNILIVDNSCHSSSTSSSQSSQQQQNSEQNSQQNATLKQNLQNNQNKTTKPNSVNKMNEIYDILKSVGFCPNNTNGSEWQSVMGGEMRSDPQELSMKFDSKHFLIDSVQGDESNRYLNQKRTPSPKNTFTKQSDYLKILNSQEKKSRQDLPYQLFQSNSMSPFHSNRGRSINSLLQRNITEASPTRRKSIPSKTTTPLKNITQKSVTPTRIQNVSPFEKRDKPNKQINEYDSLVQKELKLNSKITELIKNKFSRLCKIPTVHLHSLIEEIYTAQEVSQQKQIKIKRKSLNSNYFKEFVYDFFMKKYKNNIKICESNLFNFIGSAEYHADHSNSLIAKQFLLMVNDEYSEDQINFFIAAYYEIQLCYKGKSLQYVNLSEKNIFKITLKLFNTYEESTIYFEMTEQVSKLDSYIQSQTIAAYQYLEILMNVFNSPLYIEFKQQEQQNSLKENRKNTTNELTSSQNQKPFCMINESFGIQNDNCKPFFPNNIENGNKTINNDQLQNINNQKQSNNIKSILQNKNYCSERLKFKNEEETDFFFSNQYEDMKKQKPESSLNIIKKFYSDKNNTSQSYPVNLTITQQNIQYALFSEMEKIVCEFVQMFEIQNKQSQQKLHEMILKKCKLLVMALIFKENYRWFDLLLIDTPNYQQRMQAETIQKLYEAYERSFVQNSSSCSENKNLRSLCKLILKVPELNDAISKLLICILVPDS